MALVIGTDTYADEAYSLTYFTQRPFGETWGTSTVVIRENALRMAARHLDRMFIWKGTVVVEDQSLEWPRDSVYNHRNVLIPSTVPVDVKDAQCELAFQWLGADQLAPSASLGTSSDSQNEGIIKDKLGPLETEYRENLDFHVSLIESRIRKVYNNVRLLVDPYVVEPAFGGTFVRIIR